MGCIRFKREAGRSLVLLLQVFALWGLSWLAAYLPLPIPPGAIGLGVLFALLSTGLVRLAWIERGAGFLVRHLGLFLIPYAVSLMAFGDLIADSGIVLLIAIVASTAVGIAVTGRTAQAVLQHRRQRAAYQQGVEP
jgi:holin-like protein